MDQQEIIAGIEARAQALRMPMYEVCVKAGVHPTTFSRWKKSEKNPEPVGATLVSLSKLDAVLVAAEARAAEASAQGEAA